VITGGRRLFGRVRINGSKNSALPQMAAALLTDQPVTLREVPNLADIRNMQHLLEELGCRRTNQPGGMPLKPEEASIMALQVTDESASHARYEIVRTMRA